MIHPNMIDANMIHPNMIHPNMMHPNMIKDGRAGVDAEEAVGQALEV